MSSPIDVIREVFAARAAGDRIKMFALCHERISFSFNADPDKIGNGGTLIGWAAIQDHLARVRTHWEEHDASLLSLTTSLDRPARVNALLGIRLLHRATGEVVEGVKRQRWTVRNGIVTRMSEHLDREIIHALQRMAIDPHQQPDIAGD